MLTVVKITFNSFRYIHASTIDNVCLFQVFNKCYKLLYREYRNGVNEKEKRLGCGECHEHILVHAMKLMVSWSSSYYGYVNVELGCGFPIYSSGDASSLSYHQDIQEGDLPILCLPYIQHIAEPIQRVCRQLGVKIVSRTAQTLRQQLVKVKTPDQSS